ncbi:MAG: SDR family oxidoreductase [Chlorobi bacterium]|nr:SDR family oxidoreductase [Chlorobiota bacterium]
MPNKFEGKAALVTGGVRRLGRQISYFLASEGYNLALIYNSSPKDDLKKTSDYLKSRKIKFKFYKCDLRNAAQIKNTINKIGKDFKKLDILVNNAGVINKVGFEEITPLLFDNTVAVNLRAPLFITQHSLKYLRKSPNPLIINITSLGGLQNWSGFIPYSLSKTGLVKLTYLLARKLAPKIRVNAIAPGTIIIKGEEKGTPGKIDVKKIPLKRYGSPKDIIEAVRFLINCKYLTGHVIAVDGGRLLNN